MAHNRLQLELGWKLVTPSYSLLLWHIIVSSSVFAEISLRVRMVEEPVNRTLHITIGLL